MHSLGYCDDSLDEKIVHSYMNKKKAFLFQPHHIISLFKIIDAPGSLLLLENMLHIYTYSFSETTDSKNKFSHGKRIYIQQLIQKRQEYSTKRLRLKYYIVNVVGWRSGCTFSTFPKQQRL